MPCVRGAGRWRWRWRAQPCAECRLSEGHAASSTGLTSCRQCPPGRADTDDDTATPCQRCGAGTFAGSALRCAACPAGAVDSDRDPATPCRSCPVGTYSNDSLACAQVRSACDRWPICLIANPTRPHPAAGREARRGEAASRRRCGANAEARRLMCGGGGGGGGDGMWCAWMMWRIYTQCSTGRGDVDHNPATPCERCGAGTYATSGAAQCGCCPPGRHDHDGDATTACRRCAVGRYAPKCATRCRDCPAGRADRDRDPATRCHACPGGSYSRGGPGAQVN
jgi:ribosomal protein L37E